VTRAPRFGLVLPVDDIGLQRGISLAYFRGRRVKERALRRTAEAWRPWRGVAARLLWSYYALLRKSSPSPVGGEGRV